jgi:hypothetical protein
MGGPGNGPRRPLGRKRTIESTPRLTLAQLRGAGALTPHTRAAGVFACPPLASPLADPGYRRRATVAVRCETETGPTRGSVTLLVQSETGQDVATEAALVTTRGRAGRLRWWLRYGRTGGAGGRVYAL